mmetsp:Transcript_19558/g.50047  ORF Transcript_19558/g.50047 Transcript_19558/m.50047 type:complete len:297 (-) Transcript_19558:622-1512(-)
MLAGRLFHLVHSFEDHLLRSLHMRRQLGASRALHQQRIVPAVPLKSEPPRVDAIRERGQQRDQQRQRLGALPWRLAPRKGALHQPDQPPQVRRRPALVRAAVQVAPYKRLGPSLKNASVCQHDGALQRPCLLAVQRAARCPDHGSADGGGGSESGHTSGHDFGLRAGGVQRRQVGHQHDARCARARRGRAGREVLEHEVEQDVSVGLQNGRVRRGANIVEHLQRSVAVLCRAGIAGSSVPGAPQRGHVRAELAPPQPHQRAAQSHRLRRRDARIILQRRLHRLHHVLAGRQPRPQI